MNSATNFPVRAVVDVVRHTDLKNAPRMHDANSIGKHHGFFQVMRDVNKGHTELAMQAFQLGLQRLLELDVERGHGLVEQEHAG